MRAAWMILLLAAGVADAKKNKADRKLEQALAKESASDIDAAIEMGADINKPGQGGQTPLMAAVLQGKTANVVALLKHNPDVTIGEKDGYTPFHGVGFQGRADLVPILKEHGLDMLGRHKDGFIGMHRACWGQEQRHTDTVEAFLKAGVPHDYPDNNGKTPVELTRNPNTAKLLEEWAAKTAKGDL